MQLNDFRSLILQMPVRYQAFHSKKSTWKRCEKHVAIGNALKTLFEDNDDVFVSRRDLFSLARSDDLTPFILATIMWGYPRGMRGNHFQNLLGHFRALLDVLRQAKDDGIEDWDDHFRKVDQIEGLGLSTHTKFLHFLGVRVKGLPALILDDRIIQVVQREVFADLVTLRGIGKHNKVERYPEYLSVMDSLATSLQVSADAPEFFPFEFGLVLKLPPGPALHLNVDQGPCW